MHAARRLATTAVLGAALVACASSAPVHGGADATRVRCGWFENPTPANATLTDRDGTWTISEQGGHEAKGAWPRFAAARWVRTGAGSYGYGCACLTVADDPETRRIQRIARAASRPLETCRADPALKEPYDPLADP